MNPGRSVVVPVVFNRGGTRVRWDLAAGGDPGHLAALPFRSRSPPFSTGTVPQVWRQLLCAGSAIILQKDMETIRVEKAQGKPSVMHIARYDSLPPQKKTRRSALRFLRVRSVGKNVR